MQEKSQKTFVMPPSPDPTNFPWVSEDGVNKGHISIWFSQLTSKYAKKQHVILNIVLLSKNFTFLLSIKIKVSRGVGRTWIIVLKGGEGSSWNSSLWIFSGATNVIVVINYLVFQSILLATESFWKPGETSDENLGLIK